MGDHFFHVISYLFIGGMGAVIGSFLNVCIYRLPRSQSIVSPRSRCPSCGTPIAFYDNIPILSYFFLKGSCRSCHARISPRYPFIECVNAAAYISLWYKYGCNLAVLFYAVFFSMLLVISMIDLDFRIIPDALSISGVALGFIASFFVKSVTPLQSILGILTGGGFLFLVAVIYEKVAHKEGMGGGDIKLLAMIGAFLGWQALPFVILISSFSGALVGIFVIAILKKDMKFAIPFGPFLSFGATLYLFMGPMMIHWYLNLSRV